MNKVYVILFASIFGVTSAGLTGKQRSVLSFTHFLNLIFIQQYSKVLLISVNLYVDVYMY